ncbi:MAG: MBL fold metallo-hydrolase [Sciscionella sp.]
MCRWVEVADGVLVRRHRQLNLSTGLVLGEGACLVIDTGGDETQGAKLASAVREVTAAPWTIAITHGHFDHCFGTAAFGRCAVYAHRDCPGYLRRTAATQRAEWAPHYPAVSAVDPVLPGELVPEYAVLDVGGRRVELRHFGPAHTDHDLVVWLPDSRVMFAGDLVEQGAPPSIGPDSRPASWPGVLDRLIALRPEVVVPGHGEPVDTTFVAAQRELLSAGST